ncbi:MAG: hypothetical protein K2Q34_08680 [Alphaproteobacteria bacterium]|nr:hypothetical protein [Alphaproteobacteria bacterium]
MIIYLLLIFMLFSPSHADVTAFFNTPLGGSALCKMTAVAKIDELIAFKREHADKECSIKLAMYELEDPDLLEGLVRAQQRGIKLNLLLDKGAHEKVMGKIREASGKAAAPGTFAAHDKAKKDRAGMALGEIIGSIILVGNPYTPGVKGAGRPRTMHEKFAIFSCAPGSAEEGTATAAASSGRPKKTARGGEAPMKAGGGGGSSSTRDEQYYSVLVGSYNWTDAAAEINYENCLLIDEESADVGRSFDNRFDEISVNEMGSAPGTARK